jgi:hypothetical protein
MHPQNVTGTPNTGKVKKCDVTFIQTTNVGTFTKMKCHSYD